MNKSEQTFKSLKYYLFLGLFFVGMWMILAIISGIDTWIIIIGAILIEAAAWLGGKN